MGLSLLAPLFLLALAAVAVPVVVHLTARDRRDAVRFPSLKFLRRLPYREERRQRLRHPLLFALRALAVALLALAFARPLFLAATATADGAPGQALAIVLDTSYSMAYGDVWERALAAARDAVESAPPGASVALLTFAGEARVVVSATTDRAAVLDALDAAMPGSGVTRFAPALRLAADVLLDSPAHERRVVLVSDFQARAWDRAAPARLAPGVRLTAVDLSSAEAANALIADVETRREDDGVALVARLANRGSAAVRGLPVTLEMDGRELDGARVDLEPAGVATVTLGPIAPPRPARVTIRSGGDPLPIDGAFHLTLTRRPPVPVLLVEAPDARDAASLYLREALAIAAEPAFAVTRRSVDRLGPADVVAAAVVVFHDSPPPGSDVARALAERVEAGGGLWVVLGSRSGAAEQWPEALLPGRWRDTVDRLDELGVSLADVDDDHPVFAAFSGSGKGNLAGPRFYRYRPIVVGEGMGEALARYADGAVALAERRHGAGRVLLWGSPLDNRWSHLPVHPVFLPLVHQTCRYLSGQQPTRPWREVGEAVDLRELMESGSFVVETPAGQRRDVSADDPFLRLAEAGFYVVTGDDGAVPLAVNVDRAESDLTALDVEAFVAASTVPADPSVVVAGARSASREERERRQGVWWWLVLGVLAILGLESWWGTRSSTSTRPAETRKRPARAPALKG